MPGHELHHGFPQEFEETFQGLGIDIHAPSNLYELPAGMHTRMPKGVLSGPKSMQWNGRWREFLAKRPNLNKEEAFAFREQLVEMWCIAEYCFDARAGK